MFGNSAGVFWCLCHVLRIHCFIRLRRLSRWRMNGMLGGKRKHNKNEADCLKWLNLDVYIRKLKWNFTVSVCSKSKYFNWILSFQPTNNKFVILDCFPVIKLLECFRKSFKLERTTKGNIRNISHSPPVIKMHCLIPTFTSFFPSLERSNFHEHEALRIPKLLPNACVKFHVAYKSLCRGNRRTHMHNTVTRRSGFNIASWIRHITR